MPSVRKLNLGFAHLSFFVLHYSEEECLNENCIFFKDLLLKT
jgi:hypothetical protein